MRFWRGKSLKSLTISLNSSGGRNNRGKITIRHRGGRLNKLRYRLIDFSRIAHKDTPAIVRRLEYDTNRNATVALITYKTGINSYILATSGIHVGSLIMSSIYSELKSGNSLPLSHIPVGSFVSSISFLPFSNRGVARAAGSFAQLLKKLSNGYSLLKLPSGEQRYFHSSIWCTYGSILPYRDIQNFKFFKAGRVRNLGIRPSVRGTAMNPVDHPHGGGQGKTSGGRSSVSPWARLTKGYVTVPNRFASPFIYKRRKR
jgi:large subunit ribosomal protein L2